MDSTHPERETLSIRPVLSAADRRRFIRFAHRLYARDPNYRAPLDMMVREQITPDKNPWFKHGEADFFLAMRGERVVGRISAQRDHLHLERYKDECGFFGFFEAEEDPEAIRALLQTAEDWCRARELKQIRGPFTISINDETGLLVEGFDTPNYLMMPHGRSYYDRALKSEDYQKAVDLFAWRFSREHLPEHAFELAEMAREHPEVTVRNIDMKNLGRDVRIIMDIYNEAWADNWGSVPLTEAELDKLASDFKLIADPDLIMIAEVGGKPAAMTLALPNLYEVFHGLKGRLFPTGWAKILWRLKLKTPKTFRVVLLGVREEFRKIAFGGLSVLLYTTIYKRAYEKGYVEAEAGWTLEDNRAINQGMRLMGAENYKTYRVYQKEL